jgi:hypothetical protein
MTASGEPRRPWYSRLLPYYLLWLALRTLYFLYLGSADSNYRMAAEAGYGATHWTAQLVCAFLAVGGAVGLVLRWKHGVSITLAALALYTSVTVFQLWRMEQDPEATKRAYVASREARGLPVREEALDVMFSETGRRLAWTTAAILNLGPLVVLLRRRADFEPPERD